jgi:hypothetical protein
MFRQDPGPCPICGQAHSACTTDSGPITQVQLPQRDALQLQDATAPPAELAPAPVESESVPVPFSTAEYSRAKHGPTRRH